MSFPTYPNYRESGVEWLGRVPSNWTTAKLKRIASFSGGGTPSRDQASFWNGAIPWVSPKDMKSEVITTSEEMITDEALAASATSLVPPGAVLLVVRSGILRHTVPVAINEVEVSLNQDMKALRFNSSYCDPRFFFRWVQGLNDELILAWSKPGATVESIEHQYLAETVMALPSLPEQRTIVAFLDRETAKIDALVEEQRRLIKLLKEKRQAVISRAVTQGLDPTVPMKDSGVEWLGDVPAHWNVTSVGRLCEQLSYGFTNPMPTSADGPFMLTANDIGDGEVRFETARRTTLEAFDTLLTEKSRPQPGDILLTKDGTLGRIAVFDGTLSCINQSVAFLRPKVDLVSSDYLAAALADGVYQDRMIYEAGGTTIKHIYISRLAKMPIAIPPLDEMKQLEKFCLIHRAAAQQLSIAADAAVTLLNERRAALISAAVTGKIDVRATGTPQAEAA
ncbi:restriction endonuclease subunit S [Sphingomonas hengshuiensis]|uniref:Type I restriction modification DNA specificity domain-containing protein n=1 Tax=Sphingomonas hengshuiensis TaxID=1609977 RepID=A0A7U5BEK8_9SPHN|nr:restriction endonuclease subunit S [Sphingomonas hengshuiensis]AJP70755.1 hypothetical protein TS85_01305 [Sphingomonas hengshuiensis]